MDAHTLRAALVAHFDLPLTPKVAAAIFAAATTRAKPPDLIAFERYEYQGFVFHVERLRDVLDELHPMHVAHWAETERHRAGIALNPDYDAMLFDEQIGRLIQFTCRKGGALVGNLRLYIGTSRHTQTKFAEEDTLYLSPEHRGGFVAAQFLRYAERCVRTLGVREIRANSKLVNKADVLMRRLKYTPVATQFVKVFDHVL
jgi:GNAT superfamily N-acetyltransferase